MTLSGKIPDKDIPAVKEAITNAIKNTTKGKHLHFSRHCHANLNRLKGCQNDGYRLYRTSLGVKSDISINKLNCLCEK